ncbi:head-to-tail stopper [Mycobacterium phage Malthus]|uniref:Head-to-tail stopper n=1 Tax=Mycobacterium phage Malthus TaxID=2592661 RepID=A0A5Q2WRP6_9CAUD|nr:head-to-tail stopper [Mycobacterium phage Malthus]WRQ08404.1 head-to-tail stopper [Mycobacterium phage june]
MFPTPDDNKIKHITREKIGENALGQPIYADEPTIREREVYGWRPKLARDGATAALDGRTITELYLLMPEGDYADGDVIELPDGKQYTVQGDVEDFNHGPFGWKPGYRLTMRRVHDGQA